MIYLCHTFYDNGLFVVVYIGGGLAGPEGQEEEAGGGGGDPHACRVSQGLTAPSSGR